MTVSPASVCPAESPQRAFHTKEKLRWGSPSKELCSPWPLEFSHPNCWQGLPTHVNDIHRMAVALKWTHINIQQLFWLNGRHFICLIYLFFLFNKKIQKEVSGLRDCLSRRRGRWRTVGHAGCCKLHSFQKELQHPSSCLRLTERVTYLCEGRFRVNGVGVGEFRKGEGGVKHLSLSIQPWPPLTKESPCAHFLFPAQLLSKAPFLSVLLFVDNWSSVRVLTRPRAASLATAAFVCQ